MNLTYPMDDWRIFDDLIAITYQSRQSDGTFLTPTSAQALKKLDAKTFTEAVGVELSTLACEWEVFATSFAVSTTPKRGDTFTASGVSGVQTWVVQTVEYCAMTSGWRLQAFQQGMNN